MNDKEESVRQPQPRHLLSLTQAEEVTKVSVAVVLPTYNEAENIESVICEIEALSLNLNVVVIDDSSPDGTADVVERLKHRSPNEIHLISRPRKLGLGTAITEGFRYLLSLEKPPYYIITMDADCSHNPKDIPKLVKAAKEGYDLVIGSRYLDGGKVVGSSLTRRLISRLINVVAGVIVGARMHDCTSGFRCYSNRYVRNVLPSLHSQTYEIQIETVRHARRNCFKIKEVLITFVNRKKGKSKLTAMESQAFLTYVVRAMLENLVFFRKVPR